MAALSRPFRHLGRRWLDYRLGKRRERQSLDYRRIFILPSPGGLLFSAMILAIWLGGVNYSNSMALLLCFLLVGIGISAMIHTFRNLSGLELRAGVPDAVYAGTEVRFPLQCVEHHGRRRYGLEILYPGKPRPIPFDAQADTDTVMAIPVAASRRGRLHLAEFELRTRFPGGLFVAWSWIRLDTTVLVYPAPESGEVPPPLDASGGDSGNVRSHHGEEDFHGLRPYQPGDSLRQVAWRTLARGQELQTKQFAGYGRRSVWLDWSAMPELPPEARLCRLTRWILDAEAERRPYGLRIPGQAIAPDLGPDQQTRCLTALALFPGGAGVQEPDHVP